MFTTLNEAGVDVSKERMEQILSGNPLGEAPKEEEPTSEEGDDKDKK